MPEELGEYRGSCVFWMGMQTGVMSFSGIHIRGVVCFFVFQDNELCMQ